MVLGRYVGKWDCKSQKMDILDEITPLRQFDYVIISNIDDEYGINYNPRGRREVRKPNLDDLYVFLGQDWILIEKKGKETNENE